MKKNSPKSFKNYEYFHNNRENVPGNIVRTLRPTGTKELAFRLV